MQHLQKLSAQEAKGLQGLFFDLDDTFLSSGALNESAYSSLFRLQESGLRLIALTGRPAAWAELIARSWPVEAAIAENGAIAYQKNGDRITELDTLGQVERALLRQRLTALVQETRLKFPQLLPADDVRGRISDFTFDIGEHEHVEEEVIRHASDFARSQGARTTRSSVHLHFTFDRQDKATGALSYLDRAGEDATRARQTFGFIGDSENDAPVFAAFKLTFGVKNLRGHFSIPPSYISQNARHEGFCETSALLCQLRQP